MKKEKKSTQSPPCALTAEEYESKSHDLAGLCQEISSKKAEASFAAKQAKEKIEELDAWRSSLAQVVRTKQEYRSVECVDRYDHAEKLVRTLRTDTHETVSTRAMELHEFQEEMDLHANPAMGGAENSTPFDKDHSKLWKGSKAV